MTNAHPLHGTLVAIATMHGKERALAPPLERRLGVRTLLATGLDTDRFGTFTGEVPREGSPLEVARNKAREAMRLTGARAAVASEGSFGPHPAAPLLHVGTELVVLLDDERGLEVVAEDVTTETNFAGRDCRDVDAVLAFAARIGFPEHHVVLTVEGAPAATVRGIGARDELAAHASRLLGEHGLVRAASDMRADRNPTRMRAIARAAERLAERAATPCPGCGWPGFGPVALERGLPCSFCAAPSELVRAIVHGCRRCDVRHELPRPDGRTSCDPGECAWCNP